MPAASWAIPVGVLSAIVIVSFVFIWLWFPRAWQKGVNKDIEDVNQLQGFYREEQRRKNREIIERFTRARAIERGEIVNDESNVQAPLPAYDAKAPRADHVGTEC